MTKVTRQNGRSEVVRVAVRLSKEDLSALDAWIANHPKVKLSRPQAIHRLMTCGLTEHPGQ